MSSQLSNLGRPPVGFRGVRRVKARWKAQITIKGRTHYIGIFDTEAEAALAFDGAARRLRGERARLNFPEA